jgi:hypothetical protein
MFYPNKFFPIPWAIRLRMATWPILFIGYSMQDFDLRLLPCRLDPATVPMAHYVDSSPGPADPLPLGGSTPEDQVPRV